MSTVNAVNPNIDATVRVFDNFYKFEVNVPAAEYDVVYSYFLKEMGNKNSAGNFTSSLFQVASSTNIPALTLLKEFQGINGVNLNASLAYYLNQIRSRATLLGVGVAVVPNAYVARNVLKWVTGPKGNTWFKILPNMWARAHLDFVLGGNTALWDFATATITYYNGPVKA